MCILGKTNVYNRDRDRDKDKDYDVYQFHLTFRIIINFLLWDWLEFNDFYKFEVLKCNWQFIQYVYFLYRYRYVRRKKTRFIKYGVCIKICNS